MEEISASDPLGIRDWFLAHQRDFLEPRNMAADHDRRNKMKILLHDLPNGVTLRDLYRGRRIADNKHDAERLVEIWVEEGRLRSQVRKPDGPGRPTTAYTLARKARDS